MPNICSNTYEKHATNIRYSTIMCNMRVIVFIIIIRRNSRYEYKALEPVRHLLGKSRHPPVTPSAVYLCNIFFSAAAALCRIICSTAVTPYFEPPKRNKYGETVTVGRSARCFQKYIYAGKLPEDVTIPHLPRPPKGLMHNRRATRVY